MSDIEELGTEKERLETEICEYVIRERSWFCNRPGHRQATCFRRFPNRNKIGGRNFSRVGPGIRGKNFGNGGTNRNFGNYAGGEMRSQDFGNGGFQNSNFGQQRPGQEQYYGRNFSQNGDVQRISDPSQQRLN